MNNLLKFINVGTLIFTNYLYRQTDLRSKMYIKNPFENKGKLLWLLQ